MTTATIPVDVVSVFTDESGAHGNLLGIIRSSEHTRGHEQRLAIELGFSETVFLDELSERGGGGAVTPAGVAPGTGADSSDAPGTDALGAQAHDAAAQGTAARAGRRARIRIFTPAAELPFAGHPCVGTAWWLAHRGTPVEALQVAAGDVAVRSDGDLVWIAGRAEWAPAFTWTELAAPADVDSLDPTAFREGKHYVWSWIDERAGHLRSRMFAPTLGVPEDEATGAAAVGITARLGRDLAIDQGAGSRLLTRMLADGFIEVGGRTAEAAPRTLPVPSP